jgi:hypothetical protein
VDSIEHATHAVLRHEQQPAYCGAVQNGTVSVVPAEWVLVSASQQKLQPEVSTKAAWRVLLVLPASGPLGSWRKLLLAHVAKPQSSALSCIFNTASVQSSAHIPRQRLLALLP